MSELKLYLPTQNSVLEARKAYDAVLMMVVLEFGGYLDNLCKAELGDRWFDQLMSEGHAVDEVEKWTSIYDPSALFGEPIKYPQSPVWQFLPNTDAFYQKLKKCRHVRNSWAHNYFKYDLTHLQFDIQHFRGLAEALNLPAAKPLIGLGVRIKKVLDGEFVANADTLEEREAATQSAQIPVEAQQALAAALEQEAEHERAAAEAEAREPRPRIGGRWIGEKPKRALRTIPRLNDIVDRITNVSVRTELGPDADAEIARWLAPKPLGDLFVDTDGAVQGHIQGEPFLLGYLGQTPQRNRDEIEGFVLPASYTVDDGDIRDEATRRMLSTACAADTSQLRAVIAAAVNPYDELKITTHGDLFAYTDDGPVKVVRVPAELWF